MGLMLERLEGRQLLASDWQNGVRPMDVDGSGLVELQDIQVLVDGLNRDGIGSFPAKPPNYTGPLCDVNGDSLLQPIDALIVVNAINRHSPVPVMEARLSTATDPDGNQVVLQSSIEYEGTVEPSALITIKTLGSDASSSQHEVVADGLGNFRIRFDLRSPVTQLRFESLDELGRTKTDEKVVRIGDAIVNWNHTMLDIIRERTHPRSAGVLEQPAPPQVARHMAMIHIAMADAMSAIDPQFESYAYHPPSSSPNGSVIAAAMAAAFDVSVSLYGSDAELVRWNAARDEALASVTDPVARDLGTQVGKNAAAAILQLRSQDGSKASSSYTPGSDPGDWNPTPPAFAKGLLPQWPGVTPFALTSGSQFRASPPPALGSAEYAAALNEVFRLGAATGSERTADQSTIAKFWADGAGTSTPPGHWNTIAGDAGISQHQSAIENARMYALLNIALADAGIASWDAKYVYDMWRPIDAIRKADSDGNAATIQNVSWTPFLTTPPFPTYTSGHSTFSGAAAAVLTRLFGEATSVTVFVDAGTSKEGINASPRSFPNFQAVAEEAGMSRIYGGIHFSFDNTAGLEAGRQVGEWAMQRLQLS